MSAPSESATSPTPCACTNISLMQLFHELKQKFPGVPDHVVSNTIELYCHDKQACETHLHSEVKASLTHAYHASSSAAARQLNELKINAPTKCRNQPIVKHEAPKSTAVKSVNCEEPQTAVIQSTCIVNNEDIKVNTDANQNIVEEKDVINEKPNNNNNATSPVTVINIDSCLAKYSTESPSDLESTNESVKKEESNTSQEKVSQSKEPQIIQQEQPESTNYRILKSNKIKSNLNEKLELKKEKKTIKKEETKEKVDQEKPKRPNTLNFIKPNPDIAFKAATLNEPSTHEQRTVSPAPFKQEAESQPLKHNSESAYRPERGYPLNLSVNVNCHMDYTHPYGDPWREDYDSPRTITSVNLTVCTPTSNMASPVHENRKDDGGFEGHVTVTVSPSTGRPHRPAPPPPPPHAARLEPQRRPARAAPDPPGQPIDRSLIERQRERLGRLAKALAQEKVRLAQLTRETRILAAPPPGPAAAQRLRDHVGRLRDQCDALAKRLEMATHEREESPNFYTNIYTGQRPPSSWQCHMCTFRNHPLLDKCEECDMPRIFVGTSLARAHDSGFGSFRDRHRTHTEPSSLDINDIADTADISPLIGDSRTIPKLNC